MRRPSFTALEALLVFSILGLLISVTLPAYRQYQVRSDLDLAAQQLTQALGRARLLSVSAQGGSPWGVYMPKSVLYQGKTFAARNTAFDELYPMPSTLIATGLLDVSFALLTGKPSASGTVVLTAINGDRRSISIVIDEQGIVVDTSDKLTICHCEANPPHTLTLPDDAWPAHQDHGDYIGPCRVPENKCK
jgi:type II secretory pathway pseudopilin PulG